MPTWRDIAGSGLVSGSNLGTEDYARLSNAGYSTNDIRQYTENLGRSPWTGAMNSRTGMSAESTSNHNSTRNNDPAGNTTLMGVNGPGAPTTVANEVLHNTGAVLQGNYGGSGFVDAGGGQRYIAPGAATGGYQPMGGSADQAPAQAPAQQSAPIANPAANSSPVAARQASDTAQKQLNADRPFFTPGIAGLEGSEVAAAARFGNQTQSGFTAKFMNSQNRDNASSAQQNNSVSSNRTGEWARIGASVAQPIDTAQSMDDFTRRLNQFA